MDIVLYMVYCFFFMQVCKTIKVVLRLHEQRDAIIHCDKMHYCSTIFRKLLLQKKPIKRRVKSVQHVT